MLVHVLLFGKMKLLLSITVWVKEMSNSGWVFARRKNVPKSTTPVLHPVSIHQMAPLRADIELQLTTHLSTWKG